jgi:bifunctional non-homologous end joining protein LigD
MAKLGTYWKKRDFDKTAEPRGQAAKKSAGTKGLRYVIQKHDATRLHYDLRLELDGVMLSWAVTRGPSLVPGEKRLAIHVEDHPIEYNTFEGIIPKGQYGGGTVMVWDNGTWTPDHDPHKAMKKGHLDFELHGEKLHGHWHLVKMRARPGERQEPWLLIKGGDEFARKKSDPDILEEMSDSAATGRTLEEIASQKKRVWNSNRGADDQPAAKPAKPAAKPKARKPAKRAKSTETSKPSGSKKKSVKLEGARNSALPDFVTPALATLSSSAPTSADWVHEIKFDGYRIQTRIGDGAVSLKTRNGLDWTAKFPTIAEACAGLAGHDAILDGEIASFEPNGVSVFSALQDDLKTGRHDRLVYYVFDLLHLDGHDLTGVPLLERKRALADLLSELPENGVVRLSEHFDKDGPTMLKLAEDLHLEGIVSKRADAPYRSGRTAEWLKVKTSSNQEFIVIGYEPSDKSGRLIRSLLLGYYEDNKLRYAGRIGTGWSQKEERDLQNRLDAVARTGTPLDKIPEEERLRRGTKWVEPKLVVEVDFRGWTGGTLVRQGSLKGVREDKPARQVVREVEKMPEQIKHAAARQKSPAKVTAKPAASRSGTSKAVEVAGVALSHPDRVYWQDAGVTKQMLAEYYTQVWDWMKPHVDKRVLSLVRCPDGAAGQCFFQKHASAGIDGRHLKLVPDDGDKSITVDGVEGVVSLAQAGVLEIHVRGSSTGDLEKADRLVFDLDPGPDVTWKEVIAAARDVRERLRALKLESFVKTTGGKGLHVVLPIKPEPWDDAKDFCRKLAEQMAAEAPERYTATIKKVARKGKIFIDYLRNSREATAIAPYSTRARPGATVSAPLTWEELGSQKVSNAFTVENLPKRLKRLKSDPWQRIGQVKQSLPRTAKSRR